MADVAPECRQMQQAAVLRGDGLVRDLFFEKTIFSLREGAPLRGLPFRQR